MSTSEEQWVEAIQKVGSATLTHPSKDGRTARQELALVLWKAAMRGDMRASVLVLKYDLGIEVEPVDDTLRVSDALLAAIEKAYVSDDESPE